MSLKSWLNRRAQARFVRSYQDVLRARNGDARGLAFQLSRSLPAVPGRLGVYASGIYSFDGTKLPGNSKGAWQFFVRDSKRSRLFQVYVIEDDAEAYRATPAGEEPAS